MRPLACLVAAFALTLPLAAQSPKPPIKNAPPALQEKPKLKVAGYRTYTVQGFTVLMHDEVFGEEAAKFERPPLEVLDAELATVVKVVNAKSAVALRSLVIWVEWDETVGIENGRTGVVVAVYRSGSPEAIAADGLHPLKANTVDVLNMKALTQGHQPRRDSGRCVLLHEFAHAVHNQVVGRDSPQIKAAYAQAMERKLYDAKTHYAATSAGEFFAELTCCYLDKLHYYPNTRADLKKHDPATFKLMEAVWSGSASKAAGVVEAKPAGDLSVKLTDLAFGDPISGPKFDPAAVKGDVVLVASWGGASANLLDRVAKLQHELQPYGLLAVAPFPYTTPDAIVAPDAAARGPGVSVMRAALLPADAAGKRVGLDPPTTLVFGHTGECVYRGSGFDAEKPARAAVGAKLLADLGDDDLPPAFKPVADAFAAGATPLGALPKLSPLLTSADATTKAMAVALQARILAPLRDQLAAVEKETAAAPLDAYLAAEKLAVAAKGTPVAAKATAVVDRLRGRPEVLAELKARPLLAPVVKLHALLLAQDGGFEPTSPRFQSRNAVALTQMQRLVADLKAKHPKSRALVEANRLAAELGVAE